MSKLCSSRGCQCHGEKMERSKGESEGKEVGDSCNLVRTGITEKPLFEQRLEGGRGWAMELSGRRVSQQREELMQSCVSQEEKGGQHGCSRIHGECIYPVFLR